MAVAVVAHLVAGIVGEVYIVGASVGRDYSMAAVDAVAGVKTAAVVVAVVVAVGWVYPIGLSGCCG